MTYSILAYDILPYDILTRSGKNLGKNEENPCSTCLQPIFWLNPGTQKSDFGYPFHH